MMSGNYRTQHTSETEERRAHSPFFDLVVVLTLLNALGFPGNYETYIGESGSMTFQYAVFIMQLVVMLFSSGKTMLDFRPLNLKKKYMPVYLCLAVFFIDSMLVTSAPREQLISCLRFTVTAMFGLWIVDNYRLEDLLVLLYKTQWIFVVATLIFLVINPGMSFNRQNNNELSFTGLFTVKNSCALELCYGVMCQLALMQYKSKRRRVTMPFLALIVIELILLVLCRATGALFCCFVPMGYIFYWSKFKGGRTRPPLGTIYTVVTIMFIVTAPVVLSFFAPFLESLGKNATLTGRTGIWEGIINLLLNNHTLTGYGFSMFWRDEAALKVLHSMFKQDSWYSIMEFGSHNVVLELWLDVGMIGVASYFIMILSSLKNIRKMPKETYAFCFLFLIAFMLKGLTERAYTTNNFQTLFIFLLCGLGCTYNVRTGTLPDKRKELA